MERDKTQGELTEAGLAVDSVDTQTFAAVTAKYLLENRKRLESSRVPIFLITAKKGTRFDVKAVTWGQIAAPEVPSHPREFALPRQWTTEAPPKAATAATEEDAFFVRWNALMAMPPGQRIQELSKGREDFERQVQATKDPEEKAKLVLGIAELTFMVNRATINLNKEALTEEDHTLVKETVAIIQSVIALIQDTHQAVLLFQTLQSLSNGQILNHVIRVFATMVSFLVYYNDLHAKGLNQKIRALFPTVYKETYKRFLPDLRESLFTSDNLVRLPQFSVAQVRVFALGALMHDIGKILDLGYFENGAGYDAARIKQHPILGSGLFQRTYGEKFDEARYIVGDHHNYLFHPDGYGLSRWERARGQRGSPEFQCCVADALDVFTAGHALGYLPVEICALIDVYDALTDDARIQKAPKTPEEALRFIASEFRDSRKVDPIVFDLFIDFLKTMGTAVPENWGLQARYDQRKAAPG